MMKKYTFYILSVAVLSLLPLSTFAQQATLTDDSTYPQDVGSTKVLVVQGPTAVSKQSASAAFIKFKLTGSSSAQMGDIPSGTPGKDVKKATFRLFVAIVTTPASFDVFPITGAWAEGGTTGPPYDTSKPVIRGVQVTTSNTYIAFDITPLVKQWLDYDQNTGTGLQNNGIAIVPAKDAAGAFVNPSMVVQFDSKESSLTSHEARLSVILDHVAEADHAKEADHAQNADKASYATTAGTADSLASSASVAGSQVVGDVNAGQVSGALTKATIEGSKVIGAVDSAKTANTVSVPLALSGPGTVISGASTDGTGMMGSGKLGIFGRGETGISAQGDKDYGIFTRGAQIGLYAIGPTGIYAQSDVPTAQAISAQGANDGVSATTTSTTGGAAIHGFRYNAGGLAGKFDGPVQVNGDLALSGNLSLSNTGSISAPTINAGTRYNINGTQVLSIKGQYNTFVGPNAGFSNTTGTHNTYTGVGAGYYTTTGNYNSFFGDAAGMANTEGGANSFFGWRAGGANTTGNYNSIFGVDAGSGLRTGNSNAFFGHRAGEANSAGSGNAFFGSAAGFVNSTGDNNSAFGPAAGYGNKTGSGNVFVGHYAGSLNTTGSSNTFLGAGANTTQGSIITNATAVGANAIVSQSDSVVLGNNANVGIGTSVPQSKLHVAGTIQIDGAGSGLKFPDGTMQTTAASGGLSAVSHDASLSGDGTGGSPLSIATVDGGKVTGAVANATTAANLSGTITGDKVTTAVANATSAANATTADTAKALAATATVPAGQVSGALSNATIEGGRVTGIVADAASANTLKVPISLSSSGTATTVFVRNWENGSAIGGISDSGNAIVGSSNGGAGVNGNSTNAFGVWGASTNSAGVAGVSQSRTNAAVRGDNTNNGFGVLGFSGQGPTGGTGVYGTGRTGVEGAGSSFGVFGASANVGVFGQTTNSGGVGVKGVSTVAGGLAGQFDGNVAINGNLTLSSGGGVTFPDGTRQTTAPRSAGINSSGLYPIIYTGSADDGTGYSATAEGATYTLAVPDMPANGNIIAAWYTVFDAGGSIAAGLGAFATIDVNRAGPNQVNLYVKGISNTNVRIRLRIYVLYTNQ